MVVHQQLIPNTEKLKKKQYKNNKTYKTNAKVTTKELKVAASYEEVGGKKCHFFLISYVLLSDI